MTGAELRAARERLGATHREIAELTNFRDSDIAEWERSGRIPRAHRYALSHVLWQLERDQAVCRSGLPECGYVRSWEEDPDSATVDAFLEHVNSCPTCVARARFVDRNVPPQPIGGTLMNRCIAIADRLTGWKRSALFGAGMLLMMGGYGVPILLGFAILRGSGSYAAAAAALFLLLVVSGAAGGIVHGATAGMRARGMAGHYASSMLVVQAYLATLFASGVILALIFGKEWLPRRALT